LQFLKCFFTTDFRSRYKIYAKTVES
jgi:hypothetical protein